MNRIFITDIASYTKDETLIGHYYAVANNYKDILNCIILGGPIYKKYFQKANIQLLPYNSDHEEHFIYKKIKQLVNCKRAFNIAKGETIILQQSALATAIIGLYFFKHKNTKVYLIAYNDEGYNSIFKKIWYQLAKNKIAGIICPNEKVGNGYGRPYCVVPDYIYVDNMNHDITQLDFMKRKYDFCILGRLSPEKGVIEVVDFFSKSNYKIVIAGLPQDEKIEGEIRTKCKLNPNIELRLSYITNNDYYNYIRNSKYCILNYSEEYSNRSSGVVYDMLFNRTPVIGKYCNSLLFVESNEMGSLYYNIFTVDFNKLLTEKIHAHYVSNINRYMITHKEYINKLKNFIYN